MRNKHCFGVFCQKLDRKKFPWLDSNGAPLSEDKLKLVSRSWSRKTWQRYLKTIEVRQGEYLSHRTGDLHYTGRIDVARWLYENGGATTCDSNPAPVSEELIHALQRAVRTLTVREWQVIEAIFYDGLSQSQTAIRLDVTKERVHYLLHHSIEKIRSYLVANEPILCPPLGGSHSPKVMGVSGKIPDRRLVNGRRRSAK